MTATNLHLNGPLAEITRVGTTTLLPSGALVSAVVTPLGDGRYEVSDGAAGLQDLFVVGITELTGHDRRRGARIAERLGLTFNGETFAVRDLTADQVSGAVVFVAEAAREWASSTTSTASKKSEKALTEQVEAILRNSFPAAKVERERELIGASTKRHRFDLVMEMPGTDRVAIFEMVSPNPVALSAAHLKLFDLKNAHADWPREVVTETLEAWDRADMALLSSVATHVRGMDGPWSDLASLAS